MSEVAQYNAWKQQLAAGTTNMGFSGWKTAQWVASQSGKPPCDHPWWAVGTKTGFFNHLSAHPTIRCDICGTEWRSRP